MLLPTGKSYKTGLSARKINLANALTHLFENGFSGYLRFTEGPALGLALFRRGHLTEAIYLKDRSQPPETGVAALTRISGLARQAGTVLDVFSLAAELADQIHAVLQGEVITHAQHLALVSFEKLLQKVASTQLNGCVRVYAEESTALLFCQDGTPVYCHSDGMLSTSTSSDAAAAIAKLPDAKVDVIETNPSTNAEPINLLDLVDLEALFGSSPAPPRPPVQASASPQPVADVSFLETLFAKAVGPIAQIIFQEKVDIWRSRTNATQEDVGVLVSLLNEEIDDEERLEIFTESLEGYLAKS